MRCRRLRFLVRMVVVPGLALVMGCATSGVESLGRKVAGLDQDGLVVRAQNLSDNAPPTDYAGTSGVASSPPSSRSPVATDGADAERGTDEEVLPFPDIHDDPLGKSGIPASERDPFVFPKLMNLLYSDRWNLDDDPVEARKKRYQRESKIDIRDPDPDTANFPNGAYTLPKGRIYLENSPLGLYGKDKTGSLPKQYNWEFLFRYGLTNNLEFRLFSNGYTAVSGPKSTTGFSPLAFDFKFHCWEENRKYFIPAVGVEVYIQTIFGSPILNNGTQPSLNLLFDQTLPWDIGFEYNLGMSGTQNQQGNIHYQFSYQWSFQKEIFEDFDVFVHGFYNAASLPRLRRLRSPALLQSTSIPTVNVVGVGFIWTVNNRLALFGSYNLGTNDASPSHIALLGFAIAM